LAPDSQQAGAPTMESRLSTLAPHWRLTTG